MLKRSVLLLAAAICLTAAIAAPACASARESAVIVLKYASPLQFMNALGMLSDEEASSGRTLVWSREDARSANTPPTKVPMDGVILVVPCEQDKSLIVYGTSEGIAELRDITAMLDVKPKQVAVKAEVYRLSMEQARKMGLAFKGEQGRRGQIFGTASPEALKRLKTDLQTAKKQPVSTPAVTTTNNTWAMIGASTTGSAAKGKEASTGLMVRPRVNGDDTLTLFLDWSVSQSSPVPGPVPGSTATGKETHSVTSNRRVSNGETIIALANTGDGSDVTLLLITPQIVKE